MSQMPEFEARGDEADPIAPTRIRHSVDEIYAQGELEQRYNFIVYEFERSDAFISARTYLDEIDVVSIRGPSKSSGDAARADAPAFEAAVMAYLERRFRRIDRLDPDERSATGYMTIWRADVR